MVFDKKEYHKKYYEEHKLEKKEYRILNKDKISNVRKKYCQTEKGKKSLKKAKWKNMGVNLHNFDEYYEIYCQTTNCDICDRILTKGNPTTETTKCLDHCHKTGEFRCILCHSCNSRRK